MLNGGTKSIIFQIFYFTSNDYLVRIIEIYSMLSVWKLKKNTILLVNSI